MTPGASMRCVDPEIAELATPYCFGDATEGEARRFELHLLECSACWEEVQRLESAVRALRADMTLAHTLTVGEMAGLLGMSASLDRPFAGHRVHVLAASVLGAAVFAVPVLVEVAYQWDRYRTLALALAPAVFAVMLAAMLGVLTLTIRRARHGRGLGVPLLALGAASALLFAAVWPLFGVDPVVEAAFQTYPLRLSYLKAIVHAWMVLPVFVLWPLHAVVVLQRELAAGRHAQVAALLTGDKAALPPRGLRYPPVWALVCGVAAIFVFHWLGVAHLFDNLAPAPHKPLFMGLVMLRVGLLLALPSLCVWWYRGCLDELKREALAVLAFTKA